MTILDTMRETLKGRCDEVDAWFAAQWKTQPPFIYTSVDIRHSGHKITPVDTNLFPAGFNNLSAASRAKAVAALQGRVTPGQKLLLLPEEHTRNLKYLDSLAILADILREAGAEVVIGTLDALQQTPLALTSAAGYEMVQYPLTRRGDRLATVEGFEPDAIVLNNDFTPGLPVILHGVAQPMLPPAGMGWYRRQKSEHFRAYRECSDAFAKQFGLDGWLLQAEYDVCGTIDFMEMKGVECVALTVEKLTHRLKEKYRAHGIASDPFVFIKSNSGTYGMGIMTARSGEEVMEMNRKNRKKMQAIKGGTVNTEVIIQEGIPTVDRIEGHTAEPMLYLVNGVPVGGAYRVHDAKDAEQNLNSVGMRFHPLCADGAPVKADTGNCDFAVLGLIGKLAALAATRERYDSPEAVAPLPQVVSA